MARYSGTKPRGARVLLIAKLADDGDRLAVGGRGGIRSGALKTGLDSPLAMSYPVPDTGV